MLNSPIIPRPAPTIGAVLRSHLSAAAAARGRGDHALADLHEHDAERAIRAVIAQEKEAARHG